MRRVKILLPNYNNSVFTKFRMRFSNDRPFSNLILNKKQHSKISLLLNLVFKAESVHHGLEESRLADFYAELGCENRIYESWHYFFGRIYDAFHSHPLTMRLDQVCPVTFLIQPV